MNKVCNSIKPSKRQRCMKGNAVSELTVTTSPQIRKLNAKNKKGPKKAPKTAATTDETNANSSNNSWTTENWVPAETKEKIHGMSFKLKTFGMNLARLVHIYAVLNIVIGIKSKMTYFRIRIAWICA